jgi:hypothetical protein
MTDSFICQHCQSKFVKEKTLMVHVCEQKRRHLAKNEKHVQMGFMTYDRFYKLAQKQDKPKTYEDFSQSPYYNAFIKFGSFISNVSPLYPDQYIDYVVKSGVKLDHWAREELYEEYVLHLVKNEPVEVALQRSISHMLEWANNNNSIWNHYFLYVSTNRAAFDIKDGKISPWLILNCTSGKKLLANFNDEQLTSVGVTIDPVFWQKKFKTHEDDIQLVKDVVKESNL